MPNRIVIIKMWNSVIFGSKNKFAHHNDLNHLSCCIRSQCAECSDDGDDDDQVLPDELNPDQRRQLEELEHNPGARTKRQILV